MNNIKAINIIQNINKIILSDTTERGEGEHKILQYLKKRKEQSKINL